MLFLFLTKRQEFLLNAQECVIIELNGLIMPLKGA